jgi:hypothetical protein
MIIISISICILGLYVIFWNWRAFYNNNIKLGKYISYIPILGSILTIIGLSLFPNNPYAKLSWLVFLIDYTAFPYVIHILVFLICKIANKIFHFKSDIFPPQSDKN